MASAESSNLFRRSPLTCREGDEAQKPIEELNESAVALFATFIRKRVRAQTNEETQLSLQKSLEPLFEAKNPTVRSVAFHLHQGAAWFELPDMQPFNLGNAWTPDEDALYDLAHIARAHPGVKKEALRRLFLFDFKGKWPDFQGRREDYLRDWLMRFPEAEDLVFESLEQFRLYGPILEFLTEHKYREHQYRERVAETILRWPQTLGKTDQNEGHRGYNERTKIELELLVQIQKQFPEQLGYKAMTRIRERLEIPVQAAFSSPVIESKKWTSGGEFYFGGETQVPIKEARDSYRIEIEFFKNHPEHRRHIWDTFTNPQPKFETPKSILFDQKFVKFVIDLCDLDPSYRPKALKLLTDDLDHATWDGTETRLLLTQYLSDNGSKEDRDQLLDTILCDPQTQQCSQTRDWVSILWKEAKPEDKMDLLCISEWLCENEDQKMALYIEMLEDGPLSYQEKRTDQYLYQTNKAKVEDKANDFEDNSSLAWDCRLCLMRHDDEYRTSLWEQIKALDPLPSRSILGQIAIQCPDLAPEAIAILTTINDEELDRVENNQPLTHAKRRNSKTYKRLAKVVAEDDNLPHNKSIADYLMQVIINRKQLEPGIPETDFFKPLTKLIASPHTDLPTKKQAWQELQKIMASSNSYDISDLKPKLWRLVKNDDQITPNIAWWLYKNGQANTTEKKIVVAQKAGRETIIQDMLEDPRLKESTLDLLEAAFPEYKPDIDRVRLPSIERIIQKLGKRLF